MNLSDATMHCSSVFSRLFFIYARWSRPTNLRLPFAILRLHRLPPTAVAFRPPRRSPPVALRPVPATIKTRRPEQPAPRCLGRGVESETAPAPTGPGSMVGIHGLGRPDCFLRSLGASRYRCISSRCRLSTVGTLCWLVGESWYVTPGPTAEYGWMLTSSVPVWTLGS